MKIDKDKKKRSTIDMKRTEKKPPLNITDNMKNAEESLSNIR